jgi:predicted protein tyrosine phosphatase
MIHFMGRQEIEDPKLIWEPHILISFSDPDSPIVREASNPVAMLRLRFDDVDAHHARYQAEMLKMYGREMVFFTDEMADDVVAFVRRYDPVANHLTVLTHCEAGISRSSGAAAALADALGVDYYRRPHKPGVPNRGLPNALVRAKIGRAWYKAGRP